MMAFFPSVLRLACPWLLGFALSMSCSASAFAIQPIQDILSAAGTPLPIKFLKYTSAYAGNRVWELRDEHVNEDGSVEFKLRHIPSLRNIEFLEVTFHETFGDSGGVTAQEAIDELIDALKQSDSTSKQLPLPAGLKGPKQSVCRSISTPWIIPRDTGDRTKTLCFAVQKDWRLLTFISYNGALRERQKRDINQLLSTVRLGRPLLAISRTPPSPSRPPVFNADPRKEVSIDMRDIDIRSFLGLYFERSGIDYLISPTVSGKVNYRAVKKPQGQVLAEILHMHGLAMLRSDVPSDGLLIGRACELDFVASETRRLRDSKAFDAKGWRDRLSLSFSAIELTGLSDVLASFSGVPIQIPPGYENSVLSIDSKDLTAGFFLLNTMALSGLQIQAPSGKPAIIHATPSSEKCFANSVKASIDTRRTRMAAGGTALSPLEHHALDELYFKGFLRDHSLPENRQLELFAVTAGTGRFRVTNDALIGKNNGKITAISETGAEIEEVALDPHGNWYQRKVSWPRKFSYAEKIAEFARPVIDDVLYLKSRLEELFDPDE